MFFFFFFNFNVSFHTQSINFYRCSVILLGSKWEGDSTKIVTCWAMCQSWMLPSSYPIKLQLTYMKYNKYIYIFRNRYHIVIRQFPEKIITWNRSLICHWSWYQPSRLNGHLVDISEPRADIPLYVVITMNTGLPSQDQ